MGFVVGCLQAIYGEAIRMLEEYEKAVSAANHGGVRDHHTLYPHFGLACSPQINASSVDPCDGRSNGLESPLRFK
ncbi:hypothetical protein M5K25_021414 [Dendrobium thyrsiflorum]|uniref:Uncharacterized protein n=1 Tax=Dendrobium thyrsiflorum TaxID=117978 RepID=A0ABD0UJC4_DENTH